MPAVVIAPRAPHRLVRRGGHAAGPRPGHPHGAPRRLVEAGRHLPRRARARRRLPHPRLPRPAPGRRPGRRTLPVRARGHDQRPPRGHAHRQALPDEGLVRARHEPHPVDAEPEGDDRAPSRSSTSSPCATSSPPRSRSGPTSCSRRTPTSSATTTFSLGAGQAALRRPAPAGGAVAVRHAARLADREGAGRGAGRGRLLRLRDLRGVPRDAPRRARGRRSAELRATASSRSSGRRRSTSPTASRTSSTRRRRRSSSSRSRLAEPGFDPLPVYRPQPEPPPGRFRLLYGRSPLHTFGRTQNNPILHDLEPDNTLWMSPPAAGALGSPTASRCWSRTTAASDDRPAARSM